jgi:hypothetical protein
MTFSRSVKCVIVVSAGKGKKFRDRTVTIWRQSHRSVALNIDLSQTLGFTLLHNMAWYPTTRLFCWESRETKTGRSSVGVTNERMWLDPRNHRRL